MRLALLLSFSILNFQFSLLSNAEPAVKRDIAYGKHERQVLDLYLPASPENAPVMLFIHGGGWRIGDKRSVQSKPSHFNDQGWIFASASYRLVPGGEHPKNVNDVASAIAWLHEHAKEHGGDPDKIFIMGHSAGCHLVSLVATSGAPLDRHDLPLRTIKGVIALDTQAYDIPTLISETRSKIYAGVFGTDPEKLRDASPQHHVAKGKGIPPFLILYSKGMAIERKNGKRAVYANAFQDALTAAGIPATVIDASDRSHREINHRFGTPDDPKVTAASMTFLNNILSP